MRRIMRHLRRLAAATGTEGRALYLVVQDDRVGWVPRALLLAVVLYWLTPIDLLPGIFLDDLLVVVAGVSLARWLVDDDVLADCRARARAGAGTPPRRVVALSVVVAAALTGLAVLLALTVRG